MRAEHRDPPSGALELWLAVGLVGVVVLVPVVLVAAGYTPLPLDQREGMLPWALDGGEGGGVTGRAPDARTWDAMWWDGVAQFLSWRWVLGHALRQGQVPYWSPWSFCGQPFAANGQSACFYPLAMVLCWLLPAAQAVAWLWVVHVALAVGLTAWLGRRLGLGWCGAAAAGVIYATGGFMLAWAPVQSLMMSAAWLPGALVGVELALHERRAQGAVWLAVCLAMAVLAGHMQVAGYVWLATAAYAAGRLFYRAVRGKPWPVAPVAGGFVLALLLSACQWLPTAELGMLSPRGGEKPTPQGFAFAQALALKPAHLVTLVWPAALGLPRRGDYAGFAFAEHFLGLGPVTSLLALVGLVAMWRTRVCGLMGLGVVFLLVAMGTPLAALIYYHVPALGLTAGFQRVVFVFCLAWAVVAGMGVDWLAGWPGRARGRGRAAIMPGTDGCTPRMSGAGRRQAVGSPTAKRAGRPPAGPGGAWAAGAQRKSQGDDRGPGTPADRRTAGAGTGDRASRGRMSSAGGARARGPVASPMNGVASAPVARAVVLVAMLAVQATALVVSVLPLSRERVAERPTAVTRWLGERASLDWRVLAVTPRAAWTLKPRPAGLLPPNTGAVYGLRDAQGYDSLYPRIYRDAAARWEGADPAPVTNGNMVLLENVDAPELGRLGVRYVVTGAPVGSARLKKVGEFEGAGGAVYVYERRDFQPPYRFVDGKRVVALATGLSYGRISITVPPGAAEKGGTVEIAETPYPGWRAYVDGQPVAWAADPALPLVRRVAIPGGAEPIRVDFIYWPATAALGMFLTLAGLALATATLAATGRW